MAVPTLLITIDTEGDNQWARPERVTTENARYVPRFQDLCEEYGFRPTYLVNYEMAADLHFQEFGRSVLRRGAAEIGLHIHPWNSPPPDGPYDSQAPHLYLYELPDDAITAKVRFLTDLIHHVFGVSPVSHRAGRWGFDRRVARVLVDWGYRVDCSVTPGISWRKFKGAPEGSGGPDFSGFPTQPYFLDLGDIRSRGSSALLEVPVTVKPNPGTVFERGHRWFGGRLGDRVVRRLLGPPYTWFRPNGRNHDALLDVVDWAVRQHLPVLVFMLHSSELMPGGSPTFKTAEQVETLYAHLRRLFAHMSGLGVTGMTLAEYRATWT